MLSLTLRYFGTKIKHKTERTSSIERLNALMNCFASCLLWSNGDSKIHFKRFMQSSATTSS